PPSATAYLPALPPPGSPSQQSRRRRPAPGTRRLRAACRRQGQRGFARCKVHAEREEAGVAAVIPTASPETILACRNVSRWFGGLQALRDVDITINRGEIFGLVGPNGSGKTTLVNAITGFYPPQQGQILFEGRPLHTLKPHQIAQQGIARTFQNVALFRG